MNNVWLEHFCSDAAYRTRIQLAVLDHNFHLDRNHKQKNNGQDYQYHRKYRKQTRNWDVDKVLEEKDYCYIPEVMDEILTYWQQSQFTMKSRSTSPQDPTLPHTIAHTQPPDTATIVNRKKSRFN